MSFERKTVERPTVYVPLWEYEEAHPRGPNFELDLTHLRRETAEFGDLEAIGETDIGAGADLEAIFLQYPVISTALAALLAAKIVSDGIDGIISIAEKLKQCAAFVRKKYGSSFANNDAVVLLSLLELKHRLGGATSVQLVGQSKINRYHLEPETLEEHDRDNNPLGSQEMWVAGKLYLNLIKVDDRQLYLVVMDAEGNTMTNQLISENPER